VEECSNRELLLAAVDFCGCFFASVSASASSFSSIVDHVYRMRRVCCLSRIGALWFL
jgi:hypothetical protein